MMNGAHIQDVLKRKFKEEVCESYGNECTLESDCEKCKQFIDQELRVPSKGKKPSKNDKEKESRKLDKFSQYGIIASNEAINDSLIDFNKVST